MRGKIEMIKNVKRGMVIMKKFFSLVMAIILLFLLVGCGSSGSSTPALGPNQVQVPSSSPSETSALEIDELVPSIDDIMHDISQYAENEDMQISEDASKAVSDMYNAGNTDAYLIFEYLCSNGLCTPKSNGEDITVGPILIQGSFRTGFTAAQMNLSTGELENVFTFSNNNNYSFAFDTERQNYMSCYFTQQLFDEDMTKLAVSWLNSTDSSQHVGWIDRDGNLTDVTEILHPHTTDFSSKIPHNKYALFSPDGYFVFSDLESENYCFLDTDSMTIVKEVPFVIDDSTYYSEKYGNLAYQIVFMPNGNLKALWHTKDLYAGAHIINFGEYYIDMPDSSVLKTLDYLYDNRVLCIGKDDEGYYIAEIGEGIGELSSVGPIGKFDETISCWNYAYHGDYTNHGRDGIEVLEITPHTDYRLECCTYSNGQIAFIGSRGNERFLFTVIDAENSSPTQITSIDRSWQLLFWK